MHRKTLLSALALSPLLLFSRRSEASRVSPMTDAELKASLVELADVKPLKPLGEARKTLAPAKLPTKTAFGDTSPYNYDYYLQNDYDKSLDMGPFVGDSLGVKHHKACFTIRQNELSHSFIFHIDSADEIEVVKEIQRLPYDESLKGAIVLHFINDVRTYKRRLIAMGERPKNYIWFGICRVEGSPFAISRVECSFLPEGEEHSNDYCEWVDKQQELGPSPYRRRLIGVDWEQERTLDGRFDICYSSPKRPKDSSGHYCSYPGANCPDDLRF